MAGIVIENLAAFRADLKFAAESMPQELTRALKAGGQPILDSLMMIPARRSGALAGGYGISVRSTTGSIINRVPYAIGAEWGRYGKWSGFMRYGGPGRFGAKAIDEKADEVMELIYSLLERVVTAHGWMT